jgi:hypothetical protein
LLLFAWALLNYKNGAVVLSFLYRFSHHHPPSFFFTITPRHPLITTNTTKSTTEMPSIRLTLVNNAKQTQKSAVILKVDDTSDPLADILTLAKNKLRLKKAKTLYLNHGIELADPSWLKNGKVAQDRYPIV